MPTPLTSWKEIAGYVGKGVRTVQRWETLFGLPIHRPRAGDRGTVFALPEELDAWLRRQESSADQSGLEGQIAELQRTIAELSAENEHLKQQLAKGRNS